MESVTMATILGTILIVFASFVTSAFSDCYENEFFKNDYFEIRYCEEPELLVTIECKQLQPWDNFPWDEKLHRELSNVIFKRCDFPVDLSLLNVTKSLGIERIKNLKFDKSQSQITRQNIKGFRVKELEFTGDSPNEVADDLLHDAEVENSFFLYYPSKWTTIPDNFFKNSPSLTYVLVAQNGKVTKIRRNDFTGLKNLQTLSLFQNQIDDIEAGAFDDLVSLETLDLGINKLRTLPVGIFKNLVNLKILGLYNNELTDLPADLLKIKANNVLKKIRLNHNKLSTLPGRFFESLNNLKTLILLNNNISSLPQDIFSDLTSLEELNLSENSLSTLPQDILSNLRSLEKLDLSENSLATLPPGLFNSNTRLQYLNLRRNVLETLPEKIFKSVTTEGSEIYLDYNRLTNLTGNVFFGMRNLDLLNISHNQLYSVGPICPERSPVRKVAAIDMSYNNLTFKHPSSEASIFLNCAELERLLLSNNKIDEIFFDWKYMPKIVIDLENNVITNFESSHLRVVIGEDSYLNLRNNKITTVNFDDLQQYILELLSQNDLELHAKVFLEDNPFICDCNLTSFIEYIDSKFDDRVYDYLQISDRKLKCAGPPKLKGFRLREIHPESLSCSHETNATEDACGSLCTCYNYPEEKTLVVDCSYRNLSTVPPIIKTPDNYSIKLNMSGNFLYGTPKLD